MIRSHDPRLIAHRLAYFRFKFFGESFEKNRENNMYPRQQEKKILLEIGKTSIINEALNLKRIDQEKISCRKRMAKWKKTG